MGTNKKYWKGLPELHNSEAFQKAQQNEFSNEISLEDLAGTDENASNGTSRRDFLKLVGFSTAAVALASCETPVINAVPYLNRPEDVTVGVANFYASTFYDGHDYASVLVKTREGRPIKIEGNELSKITKGGTSARIQSSILSLYDGARITGPMKKGSPATWKDVDGTIAKTLAETAASGKEIAILSSTIISPSTKSVIAEFTAKYPTAKLYQYDSVSYSALRNANEKVFGKKVVSSYNFAKASKVVVGVACDFLGNWLSPVEFAAGYAENRRVSKEKPEMSKHYHFESNMSLTGANADERFQIKPSEIGKVVTALFNEVAKGTGNAATSANGTVASNPEAQKAIGKVAKELCDARGKSLVVCGLNDTDVQVLVNGINKMLDNYGKSVDVENFMNTRQGDDKQIIELTADINAGKVGAIIFYNTNPVYTAPAKLGLGSALSKVPVKISFALTMDETAQICDYVCPDNHWLESWGDANPKRGHYSLQQPTIRPIFAQPRYEGTRQAQDTLLTWAGVKSDYLTYLQAYWQNRVFPMQGKYGDFYSFWSNTLHDGVLRINFPKAVEETIAPMAKDTSGKPLFEKVVPLVTGGLVSEDTDAPVADSLNSGVVASKTDDKKKGTVVPVSEPVPVVDYSAHASKAVSAKGGNWEIAVYEKVTLGNGNQSNNPWLHETPDPISKVTWDNYITMHPEDVAENKFNQMLRQDIVGSIANLTVNGVNVELPVYPSPGQAKGTIGVALGYGRNCESYKVCNGLGANAFAFLSVSNDTIQNISAEVSISATDKTHRFAATQIQHTIMGREEYILRETSLEQYKKDPKSNNPEAILTTHAGPKHVSEVDLWDAHPRPGHKWAMTIDMNTCIGCSACVVACTSENNISVVGKDEVRKSRDMAWLRIDRYYSSDMTRIKAHEEHVGARQMYLDMENPSNNPKVTFQPMMCQHCNHAPCETVCPVLATHHSTEGLNQMAYNRCIGTRYCANNCPFKVRRFNWFSYIFNSDFTDINPAQQDLGKMVLNPDVVVRDRGVMEKCSMCQQRLQAGKLAAKMEGKPLADGAIKTACQQACPTNAIFFGDANDEESLVSKIRKDERNYYLLEELGVKPTVSYLVKVRNQDSPILWEAEEHAVTEKSSPNKEEKHS